MKITYDLENLPERRNSTRESEEVTAIKGFLAGRITASTSCGPRRRVPPALPLGKREKEKPPTMVRTSKTASK